MRTTSRTRYAAGERYLPDGLPDRRYYVPAPRGLEIKIGEALAARRARDRARREKSRRSGRKDVLDPKLLRNDLPKVAAELARRGFALDVERVAALEEQRKAAQIEADQVCARSATRMPRPPVKRKHRAETRRR